MRQPTSKEMLKVLNQAIEWTETAGFHPPWETWAKTIASDIESGSVAKNKQAKQEFPGVADLMVAWHKEKFGDGGVAVVRAKGWGVSGTPKEGWFLNNHNRVVADEIKGPYSDLMSAWNKACSEQGLPPPSPWVDRCKEMSDQMRQSRGLQR